MCIVTWVNIENQFILTHTRDENINRTFEQKIFKEDKTSFLKDPYSGGTWMIDSPTLMGVILNGGLNEKGIIKKNQASRGEILFKIQNNLDIDSWQTMDFKQYSAFTLVLFRKDMNSLFVLSWNGNDLHFNELDPSINFLWCSSTLYNKDEKYNLTHKFKKENFRDEFEISDWHKKNQLPLGKVHSKIKSVCLSHILFNSLEKQAIFRILDLKL